MLGATWETMAPIRESRETPSLTKGWPQFLGKTALSLGALGERGDPAWRVGEGSLYSTEKVWALKGRW
jgi:hypothetical protein